MINQKNTYTNTDTDVTQAQEHIMARLDAILQERKLHVSDEKSYVSKLYRKGIHAIGKKIGEESAEVLMAAQTHAHQNTPDTQADLVHEVADLWFHTLVMLHYHGITGQEVLDELTRREGVSGIAEKNARQGDVD